MTQADWVKEFDALYYGSTCGGDGLFNSELFMDIKDFISKVELLAQQRTRKERTQEVFQWLEDQGEISKHDHERLLEQII